MKAKRIIAAMLLVTMCFTMTACAAGDSAANTDILGVTNPTKPLDSTSSSSTAQSDDAIAAGEVYRNDYFKFTCNLSNDWYVLNQDELAKVLGITYDAMGDSNAGKLVQKSFESGASQMDFYAVNINSGETINIVLTKEKLLERMLSDSQLLKASMPLLNKGLEDMGATNLSSDKKEITFMGDQHLALIVHADYQGKTIQETIFILRKDGYQASVTVTDLTGNPTDDYVDYFQVIK